MQGQTDFTCPGGAETFVAFLDLVSQSFEGRSIELGMAKSLISREAAALNIFWPHHLIGTLLGQVEEIFFKLKEPGRTGRVNRYCPVLPGQLKSVEKIFRGKLNGLVQL